MNGIQLHKVNEKEPMTPLNTTYLGDLKNFIDLLKEESKNMTSPRVIIYKNNIYVFEGHIAVMPTESYI